MRILALAAAAALSASGVLAQSLDGGVSSGLGGGVSSGLGGGISSGLSGTLGSTQQGRSRAQTDPTNGVYVDMGGCPPRQANLNHSGCRPFEWFSRDSLSSYDRSIEGLSPLRGLTLEPAPGPYQPN